jgi:hypothetical protein
MQNVVIIGGTDITPYIVNDTYKMDEEAHYESWQDGNYVEHRVIITSKVKGKFDVVLSEQTITLPQFKALLNDNNGVLTMLVYVTNAGESRAINAYYKLESKEHTPLAGGGYVDVITMEITER